MASIIGVLKRFWVLIAVVVALVAAVAVVGRLRTFFDSDQPLAPSAGHADAIVPFNTKRVTYEVVGPMSATGRISYLDVDGTTQEVQFTELPWSITVTTTDPGMMANVVAQAAGAELGCRILVNDKVVAEQPPAAQAFCLDKAA